jgi:proline iminopeptidase
VEERRLEVPGGRVWSRRVGSGPTGLVSGGGLPLLVLHGGPGAPHHYLEPLAALADERPVIFYDQLGCGESERPDDSSLWTVERFVEEVAAVREALGLQRMHLLGQSWGSTLAVNYVARVPDHGVAGMVLSGPFLSSSRWEADQRAHLAAMPGAVQAAVADAEASGDFDAPAYQDAMMSFYQRHVCRLDPWPDCLNEAFQNMGMDVYMKMWGPSEFTCTGTLRGAEFTGLLPRIEQPTLLTCGCFDEATPETTAWYHSLIPEAEMRVFEDASHNHHLEHPAEYLDLVRAFLRKHDC